jgi:hypothetical protein
MRRRELLAAATATLSGLAGCAGFGSDDRETLTQVAPATGTPAHWATPDEDCPAAPSNAEVYKCTTAAGDGLHLGTIDEGTGVGLALTNGSGVRFVTGRDWWTLSRKDREWCIVAQGSGSDRLVLPPEATYRWRLDNQATTGATSDATTLELPLESSVYGFSVTGYVTGGELTAVVTTFTV